MTRVCVTWDREETARLVARCRDAMKASDETAVAATPGPWESYGDFEPFGIADARANDLGFMLSSADADHIAANDPSTRLALNCALRTVLDGIAATLGRDYESHGRDMEHALASLTAIAAALRVES